MEMRRAVASLLPLALLFIASIAPSHGQSADAVGVVASGDEVVQYEVRGNLSLRCPLSSAANLPYVWTKNNTLVEEVPELKERFVVSEGGALWRINGRAIEDDAGNYSCSVGSESVKWEVRGRTHAKLPANTNVVEGQRLKLTCRLIGKPYPRVSWLFANSTDVNATDVSALAGVTLRASEQGAADAELVVEAATRAHAGVFTCVPAGGAAAATTTRVKDMYAALWPFLGICAEVIVLCAIILIYERRRSKPEAEDSDTDNHDQKKS